MSTLLSPPQSQAISCRHSPDCRSHRRHLPSPATPCPCHSKTTGYLNRMANTGGQVENRFAPEDDATAVLHAFITTHVTLPRWPA